ncbi:amidohydrolase [Bradyrhizobium tropiciagri]|uniref:amidohydrolase n=1 Tax=Bradyrhizobium tropiciagri TaxID=312253 RepID=UPI001BA774BD|nr:amidohydrolase [Bradyrhizobium tropiciagri]MBR0896731.1 amidohydrolase [Bradyrhizobium tropiciagri]
MVDDFHEMEFGNSHWTRVTPLTQPYQWSCSSSAIHQHIIRQDTQSEEARHILSGATTATTSSAFGGRSRARYAMRGANGLALVNGRVFTGDHQLRWSDALIITRGKISFVGSTEDVLRQIGPDFEVINVQGRTVIPGLNDAHMHHTPDPAGIRLPIQPYNEIGFEDVSELIAEAVSCSPPGTWIFGAMGVQLINEPRLNRFEIDRLAPDHPVIFLGRTNHTNIVNSKAMKLLGLSDGDPDPVGGFFERVPGSIELNGRIHEYAQWSPQRLFASMTTIEQGVESLNDLADSCLEFGITTLQNMSWTPIARYAEMLAAADLPIKIRAIRFPPSGPQGRILSEGFDIPTEVGPRARIDGIKWILDGTTVERAAALGRPYADDPTTMGRENFSADEVGEMLRESVALDVPLLLHAIGTQALETAISCLETFVPVQDWGRRGLRIEHADGLTAEQIGRVKLLGIMVVQNPSHFLLRHIYGPRFGEDVLFASFNSLRRSGISLGIGSDGPLNPFIGLMAAVTHPARPEEAVDIEAALIAYTSGSAAAEGKASEKGRLLPGYDADIAVLSQDIFSVDPRALPETRSILTIVDGQVVYCADESLFVRPA